MRYEPRRASPQGIERLRDEILELLATSERLSREMDDLVVQTGTLEREHRSLFQNLRRAHEQRLGLERDLRLFKERIRRARRPA